MRAVVLAFGALILEHPPAAIGRASMKTDTSIPNPLRAIGLARIVAGCWFVAAGVGTLRHHLSDLIPQARRLFAGQLGVTDAPIRAVLALVAAVVLIVIGPLLIARGSRWLRRMTFSPDGPAAIAGDEVIATLRLHELPAFGPGPVPPYRPLVRWFDEELAGLTWWRRDIVSQGVRTFVWCCALTLVVAACSVALSPVTEGGLLGPFPGAFVTLLPFVTAIWAVLVLLLLAPNGLRIESEEFPASAPAGEIIETPPRLLGREPPALGLSLGITGVAVQCLMPVWWNLSYVGYPLIATSIVRHLGSIAGGILFFVLGNRMTEAAAALLLHFHYDSILVLVDQSGGTTVARAAGVRTESRGPRGPRHVIAAVGGVHVRESAERLLRR